MTIITDENGKNGKKEAGKEKGGKTFFNREEREGTRRVKTKNVKDRDKTFTAKDAKVREE